MDRSCASREAVSLFRAIVAGAIAAIATFASPALSAGVLYATGFESPPFTAGVPIAGQDGWTSRLGSAAGTISTLQPANGLQALEFRADTLPEFGFGFNLESLRRLLDFDVMAAGVRFVTVEANVRLNGPSLQDDLVEAIISAIDPNFGSYGEMQISANGDLFVYGSQFVDVFVGSVSIGAYHSLAMSIDFFARATTFFLDGVDLVTFGFDPSLQTNVFRAASVHMAAPTDRALADPTLYTAYFDDLRIAALPEPSTPALATIVLLAWAVVRRRKSCG